MKKILFMVMALVTVISAHAEPDKAKPRYIIGTEDVLNISVLAPDQLNADVAVAPDGTVTFPYIGSVDAAGLTLEQLQSSVQDALADGYMQYPVVMVSLRESRSRRFFVYGEVVKPGVYFLNENVTVLKAISMAGGFTKFGSTGGVKIMRPRKDAPGYNPIKVELKALMSGDSKVDIQLEPGDIVVVSEGAF